ncbi:hypothetical protein GF386_04480 [Candidatus Pacearchaeota archaeon]|nr:hypothetical protein [Candidatus Pacearchaeota archaeon]MBD3283381.1 hypothetical protein [Candidatus Pacearchaeota archaeon]
MRYLVKVDYFCSAVSDGGQWVVLNSEKPPELGIIKSQRILQDHDCGKYHYSQLCDEDETCYWQRILEVRPFSEQSARNLNARSLDSIAT